MKNRTFWIAVGVILVIFGGLFFLSGRKPQTLSPEKAAAQLAQPFDAHVVIRMENFTMDGDLNRTAPGKAALRVTQPETLSGMQFLLDGDTVEVQWKGLSVKLDEDSRLVRAALSQIIRTLDGAAAEKGIRARMEGEALLISGEQEETRFELRLDPETGSLLSLQLPELDFDCRFDPIAG